MPGFKHQTIGFLSLLSWECREFLDALGTKQEPRYICWFLQNCDWNVRELFREEMTYLWSQGQRAQSTAVLPHGLEQRTSWLKQIMLEQLTLWWKGSRESRKGSRYSPPPKGPPPETCFLQLGTTFYFFPPLNNIIMSGIHQGIKLFIRPEIS